jgi:hypothetical protein
MRNVPSHMPLALISLLNVHYRQMTDVIFCSIQLSRYGTVRFVRGWVVVARNGGLAVGADSVLILYPSSLIR